MPWFKVDDALHSHPKARRAGLAAMGLWSLAGSHCMDYLTNGLVERWFVESWPDGPQLAGRLVDVELWLEHSEGWLFHDWEVYQPTRERVLAEREATRERVEKYRANKGGNGVTRTVTNTVSTTPPNPDPYPTTTSNEVVVNARKRASLVPRDFSISDDMRAWAAENTPLVDVDAKLGEWIDYWTGVGKLMKQWDAVWRNGMRKQQTFAERDLTNRRPTPTDRAAQTAAAGRAVAGRVLTSLEPKELLP